MHVAGDDGVAMRRALELAGRGWGHVHPNPMVGAVVVRDGAVVGEGWHAEYGGPHAEVTALAAAADAAVGATLFVTLEPCAHHGKTPPCTEAIVRAGVRRVVYAAADPNPKAAGGAAVLRAAGLDVVGGVELAAARAQNRMFFHVHERRRTFVMLKLAVSLDGMLGYAGRRTQLTGALANEATQRLRAGFDAILVGAGTARADDPLLTVRGVAIRKPPRRVVLDTTASLPLDSQLVRTAADAPVVVVCATDADGSRAAALTDAGVTVLRAKRNADGVDPAAALEALREHGVQSVLCEGGGRMAAALLGAGRVDALQLLVAARLLGSGGVPAFPLPPGAAPAGEWTLDRVRTLGDDVALDYLRKPDEED